MKVSIKWLRDYVDIDISVEELASRLTMSGLEVDAIEQKTPDFSGVVVAKVLSVKPHPGADKLSLCDISTGDKIYPVVCGAKNMKPGDVVPFATVGATIPGGYTIKSSRIRGELSEGMLCSEEELGIGSDNTGIMILPSELALGSNLQEALDLHDTILDIGVTPNRSDCLSIIGVAREIAAIAGRKLRYPEIKILENEEDINTLTSVTILDDDLCPRYTARVIRNVKVRPSPLWMRQRLEAVGLRAINNIVDITNFVMMELGQPLHAFDYRFLEEGRIVVRRSKQDEHFISLDEKDRILKSDTLMICDGVKPVAIAGIMGGLNSEVKDDTGTVLLESAYFNPTSIRRSSRWLAMGTDAAFRFERGVDPEGVTRALDRAAQLMAELSDGTVCKNYIDNYPKKIEPVWNIPLRVKRVNDFLGTAIDEQEIISILNSLEMKVIDNKQGVYLVTPPTFRVDISREIDLIEEIARLYGYDKIPVSMPSVSVSSIEKSETGVIEDRIRAVLTGFGYSEIITYSFVSPEGADLLNFSPDDERRQMVKIRNPLTEDQSVMRTNLVYSMLKTMKSNTYSGCFDLKIFEIGRTFYHKNEGSLPREKNRVGGLLTGHRYDDSWHFNDLQADFYDLKGCIEGLLDSLKIRDVSYSAKVPEPFLHPGRACNISVNNINLGWMGEIHPDVIKRMDLRNRAMAFEIDMDLLSEIYSVKIGFDEISKFPSSSRDVAFLVKVELEAEKIVTLSKGLGEELLEKVSIFDVYDGKGIPEGMKSLGLRFSYRASDRTLTDQEVNDVHGRIVKKVMTEYGAKIRGEEQS